MFSAAQSGTERAFIEAGVAQDVRADGRGRADYRSVYTYVEWAACVCEWMRMYAARSGLDRCRPSDPSDPGPGCCSNPPLSSTHTREVSVEVDVHPGANGSARVVLGQGATEVLAVVKVRWVSGWGKEGGRWCL